MVPSSLSASARQSSVSPPPNLEARLRLLLGDHLGMSADQLVGYLTRIDGLVGEPDVPPVRARAWLGTPGTGGPRLGRTFRIDSYALQVLMDDARRAGRGARLDVVVGRNTPGFVIEAIRRRLAPLRRRRIDVRVRTERRRRGLSFLFAP